MKTLEKRPESKKVTPQTKMTKKELRHYLGAAGVFILVIGLLLFLAFNDIPQANKDIFVSIIGMIVGSLSVVIYTIIGKNPDEVNSLQKKVESLQALADTMEKRNVNKSKTKCLKSRKSSICCDSWVPTPIIFN